MAQKLPSKLVLNKWPGVRSATGSHAVGDAFVEATNLTSAIPGAGACRAGMRPVIMGGALSANDVIACFGFPGPDAPWLVYTDTGGNVIAGRPDDNTAKLTIATSRNTFGPPWMTQDHKGEGIYVDGHSRGLIFNFKEATARPLGIDPPLAAPGITMASGGAATAGTYKLSYRYVDAYGIPSAISTLREVVATSNQRFVWWGLQASLQTRISTAHTGYIELFRSLVADSNSQYPVWGTGFSIAVTVTANDAGLVKFTTGSAHGLSVGDIIAITGHSVTQYNTVGVIVRIPSTTTFVLNIGYLTGTSGTCTATQRITSISHTVSITANANNAGSAQLTTAKPHRLVVGAMLDIVGTGIAGYDNATTDDSATTARVVSIQSTTQFTLNLSHSAGTPTAGATGTLIGFGQSGVDVDPGIDSDEHADTVLDDNPGWTIISSTGSSAATGYEGTIRRFVPPPKDRAVVVTFQKRTFYGVVVAYTTGTVATNASDTITGTGTSWNTDMVGRWIWIAGETVPYVITEYVSATSLRLNKAVVTTASLKTYVIKPDPTKWRQWQYSEPLEPESVPETNTVTVPQADEDHDEMTGACQHGLSLYFLFERHIFRHNFGEQPTLDGVTLPVARRGCVNQRCWTTFEGQLFLLDQFGAWRFGAAGSGTDDIDMAIHDIVRDGEIDWDKKAWFSVSADPEQRQIIYAIALKGDAATRPLRQYAYDLRSGAWSIYRTAHAIGGICRVNILGRQRLIYGGQADLLYVANEGLGDSAPGVVGLATAALATTLTDTLQAMTVNKYTNWNIEIVAGTGSGQRRRVASNTATAFTVTVAWDTTPDTTSRYIVSHDGIVATATGTPTTTTIPVTTTLIADAFKGASVAFISGTNRGQTVRRITANTTSTLTITPALPTACASGDQIAIGGVPWQGKTGLFPYLAQEELDNARHGYPCGMRVTYEPTTNAGHFGVRVFKNHSTLPVPLDNDVIDPWGITGTKGGTEKIKDITATRNADSRAAGNAWFPIKSVGTALETQEGERWFAYEVRGVQTLDRILLHELEIHGVGQA